jgi:hypothetical protein
MDLRQCRGHKTGWDNFVDAFRDQFGDGSRGPYRWEDAHPSATSPALHYHETCLGFVANEAYGHAGARRLDRRTGTGLLAGACQRELAEE